MAMPANSQEGLCPERTALVDGILAALRSPKDVGLLSCLVGMLCVIVSFIWLPVYTSPAWDGGGVTQTAWESAWEVVHNMLAQHNTLGFILPISVAFLPLTAAPVLGMLAIARAVTARPLLAKLFLVVYVLGSAPLLITVVLEYGFGFVLGLGSFGCILGYLLFLVGDLALRRASAQAAPS
jgi:hypothetical protein